MSFVVDIGNSRTKFALYEQETVRHFRTISPAFRLCAEWDAVHWGIGSVCPGKTEKIAAQIRRKRPNDTVTILTAADIPLKTDVDDPEKVGIDRLLAAWAAVRWKRQNRLEDVCRPILLCDLGTATTIDLVSPDDVFLGGAILPGMNLAAKSLCLRTALLPKIHSLNASPFPGKNTINAICAGIFEGTIGTVRRFYALSARIFPNTELLLLLTGGDSELVYPELEREFPAFCLPHLVLDGIYAVISDFS